MHFWCISLLLRWSIPSESSVFLRLHFCCMLNVTQTTVLLMLPAFGISRHSVNERMLFFFTTFSTDQVFYTSMTVIGQTVCWQYFGGKRGTNIFAFRGAGGKRNQEEEPEASSSSSSGTSFASAQRETTLKLYLHEFNSLK